MFYICTALFELPGAPLLLLKCSNREDIIGWLPWFAELVVCWLLLLLDYCIIKAYANEAKLFWIYDGPPLELLFPGAELLLACTLNSSVIIKSWILSKLSILTITSWYLFSSWLNLSNGTYYWSLLLLPKLFEILVEGSELIWLTTVVVCYWNPFY